MSVQPLPSTFPPLRLPLDLCSPPPLPLCLLRAFRNALDGCCCCCCLAALRLPAHRSDTVDAQSSAGRQALSALKRACRDASLRLQILAHRQMFELLDSFLQRRHMLAPLLYKTLIFSLIEHHQSEFVRQFVVSNMAITIRRHQELPIGVLLDPLLRQLGMYGECAS